RVGKRLRAWVGKQQIYFMFIVTFPFTTALPPKIQPNETKASLGTETEISRSLVSAAGSSHSVFLFGSGVSRGMLLGGLFAIKSATSSFSYSEEATYPMATSEEFQRPCCISRVILAP